MYHNVCSYILIIYQYIHTDTDKPSFSESVSISISNLDSNHRFVFGVPADKNSNHPPPPRVQESTKFEIQYVANIFNSR